MKASIVSLFGFFNYGNRLQSYAVQEIIRKMGLQTQVIYVQSNMIQLKKIIMYLIFETRLYRILPNAQKRERAYQRGKAFRTFNKKYISTKRYSDICKIEDADYFILGSDQVWNPKRYNDVKKQLFFLSFTSPNKKVCFAPSFGVSTIPEQWQPYFRDQLMTFPHLSVREESGAKIIKELTGQSAEVLIDPTLMLNAEDWMKIAHKPERVDTDKPYVLTYFLGGTPQKAAVEGKRIKEEINGNLYQLLDPNMPEVYTAGPAEFLYLIAHASVVQTDSFHACIFAFLFGKPFLLYAREGEDTDMLSRLDTLLTKFDLKRKYVDSGLENDVYECDYSKGYAKLSQEREKTYTFLSRSMLAEKSI